MSDNIVLKCQARDEAYRRMYYDIYRHKMRYDPVGHAQELNLSDQDVGEIKKYYKQQEESELPVRFITIGLPKHDPTGHQGSKYEQLLQRCLKKCYVGDWHYAFELGSNGTHPHYHVYFTATIKWLAKSRIIDEWSKIFDIPKNFIDVKSTSKDHIPNLEKYISKEGLTKRKKEKKIIIPLINGPKKL